jgi:hypothetical protein
MTGPLPVGLTNQQLISFRVNNNDFSGSISDDIWRLPQLTTFEATNNQCADCGSAALIVHRAAGHVHARVTLWWLSH